PDALCLHARTRGRRLRAAARQGPALEGAPVSDPRPRALGLEGRRSTVGRLPPGAGGDLARPRLQKQRARPPAAALLADAPGDDGARMGGEADETDPPL